MSIPSFSGVRGDGEVFATTVTCAEAVCTEDVDVSSTGLSQAEADAQDFFHSSTCYDTWEATQ